MEFPMFTHVLVTSLIVVAVFLALGVYQFIKDLEAEDKAMEDDVRRYRDELD